MFWGQDREGVTEAEKGELRRILTGTKIDLRIGAGKESSGGQGFVLCGRLVVVWGLYYYYHYAFTASYCHSPQMPPAL